MTPKDTDTLACPSPEGFIERRSSLPCPQELRIHDLEGSDGRQWESIRKIMETIELIQQAQADFVHRLTMDSAIRDVEAKRPQHPQPDEFVTKMKDLTFEVIKFIAIGLIAWGLMHWGGK
jgi:hypothetical protein